jgi:hypothetical protein
MPFSPPLMHPVAFGHEPGASDGAVGGSGSRVTSIGSGRGGDGASTVSAPAGRAAVVRGDELSLPELHAAASVKVARRTQSSPRPLDVRC